MTVRYDSFEAVAVCAPATVARLLGAGDATERVWAAWTLAGREGVGAVETLGRAFDDDPDPGVRRVLLVVLVGLGERARLVATAAREPSAFLRAEATRYLARLTEPDDAAAYDLLLSRAIDLSWAVRMAVADELRVDAPPDAVRRAIGLLFDPDPEVRAAMCRRIERGDFPRQPVRAHLDILARLARRPLEPPDPRVRALVRLYREP